MDNKKCDEKNLETSFTIVDIKEDYEHNGQTDHRGVLLESHPLCKCDFIFTGYRKRMTFFEATKSIFSWHNESVNIWSHLLAFPIFLVLMLETLFVELKNAESDTADYFVFGLFSISAQMCVLFSAIYHSFGCMSWQMFSTLLKLDLSGICALIYGSFVVSIYYAFYCEPFMRGFYIGGITVLIGVGTWLNMAPRFAHSRYDNMRFGFYAGIVVAGLVPTCHWALLVAHGAEALRLGPYVAAMFVCYGVGFWFWTSRWPESRYPGRFDNLLSSHQLWHFCIVAAVLVFWQGMRVIFRYRKALDTCDIKATEAWWAQYELLE